VRVLDRMLSPTVLADLRATRRTLVRQPWHFGLIASTLALATLSLAVVAAIGYSLLFRPLPYRDADRLALVWDANPRRAVDRMGLTPARYLRMLEDADVFEQAAAVTSCVPLTLSDGVGQRELTCQMVTANLFDVLGVRPALGTTFAGGSASRAAGADAILGDSAWREHFGADPAVVGRQVGFGAQRLAIAGVLPPGLEVLNSGTDVWVPFDVGPGLRAFPARYLIGVARLKPGWTLGMAQARFDALDDAADRTVPLAERGWRHRVVALDAEVVRTTRPAIWAATLGALLVVILVCTNALFLKTVRQLARARELAIRSALGASRRDLARASWLEAGVVLAVAAGMTAAGAALSRSLLTVVVLALPDAPRVGELTAGTPAMLPFAALASFVLVAATYLAVGRPWRVGNVGAPGLSLSLAPPATRVRWRWAVAGEMAIAVLFVSLAVLLTSSVQALSRSPLGFDTTGLLTGRLLLSGPGFDHPRRLQFVDDLLTRLQTLPGVASADIVRGLPMSSPFGTRAEWFGTALGNSWETLICRRSEDASSDDATAAVLRLATPDYLRTLGPGLLQGRALTRLDYTSKAPVAVVSASLSRQLWGGNAVGRRMTCAGTTTDVVDIVGVVDDVRDRRPDAEPQPTIYAAYTRQPLAAIALVVRTTAPDAVAAALPGLVQSLDRRALLTDVRPMSARVDAALARPRMLSGVFGLFAGLAIALAFVGAYGVARADVRERRRALAIELALGAGAAGLCRRLLTRGLVLAGLGAVAGGGAAFAMSRLLASLLHGLEPAAALGSLVAAGGLLGLVFAAAHVPAIREIRALDPVELLRE
jgi:putative ABC transport system permease protein